MSIKSDKWIRQMAKEHGMISPFEPGQVTHDDNGKKLIGYGTSSYGYDIRCAPEFKIFTNVNSVVVDPKAFDPKAFVDFEGDVCIIPPNSFVLARTVEYFRIPRKILTICVGKSTYARCFSGDTKVAVSNGGRKTFLELIRDQENGVRNWGYSVDESGAIVLAELKAARKIGHEKIIEVTLDNGEKIRCTPDHKFLLRNGSFVEARELKVGCSLMPLYRTDQRGYEAVYQPTTGHTVATYRLADLWNLQNGVYTDERGTHRHHQDHDKANNDPTNICRVLAGDHIRHHNEDRFDSPEKRSEHGLKIQEAFRVRRENESWVAAFRKAQKAKADLFWKSPEYAEDRARALASRGTMSDSMRAAARDRMRAKYMDEREISLHSSRMRAAWEDDPDRKARQAMIARAMNIRDEITADVVRMALRLAGSIRGAARSLGCDRSVFRRFSEVVREEIRAVPGNNHKVVEVKELETTEDVYCLSVPGYENFALDCGVFVKNCGLVVNVTPFEPEWEGHVTLEFSNTTPLPMKLYAGEGCAQVLFFESDEDCEVSYRDRGGKYQGQTGVTMPRMLG